MAFKTESLSYLEKHLLYQKYCPQQYEMGLTVGNGGNESLWFDWWCGSSPIAERMTMVPNHRLDLKVKDIMFASGGWDMEKIALLFSPEVIDDIFNTPIPTNMSLDDKPSWGGKRNGKFCLAKQSGQTRWNSGAAARENYDPPDSVLGDLKADIGGEDTGDAFKTAIKVIVLYMDVLAVIVMLCIVSFAPIGNFATTFDVVKYGAVGDGKTDDTQAFLKAWNDFCLATDHDNPILNIPKDKTFLLGPLSFNGPCKSSTPRVQVLGNLVAPTSLAAWKGCVQNSWIVFSAVNGLIVDGPGKIDGQGSFWWRQGRQTPTCGIPTALRFFKCDNMKLNGLNHLNPPKNHMSIDLCKGAAISNLHITAPGDSPNTDGIDIVTSTQVQIHDLNIQTGDDCIAINNGSSYINIERVACGPGHGISVGSLGEGESYCAVEEIHVQNCNFTKSENGCRIKSWPGGSGYARYISFVNITLDEVQNPIIIDQHYCDYAEDGPIHKYCSDKKKAVKISDVTYKNVQGSSATKIGITLDCSSIVGCANIAMDHVDISGDGVIASCNNAKGTASHTSPQVPCLSSS
ncbi:hypothetical protein LguiA_033042 [Lonicera macranthoides]